MPELLVSDAGQQGGPLSARECQVADFSILGVANNRAVGEVGDLHAVTCRLTVRGLAEKKISGN